MIGRHAANQKKANQSANQDSDKVLSYRVAKNVDIAPQITHVAASELRKHPYYKECERWQSQQPYKSDLLAQLTQATSMSQRRTLAQSLKSLS